MEIFIVQVTNSKGVLVQQSNAYKKLEDAVAVERAYSQEYEEDHYTCIVSFELV